VEGGKDRIWDKKSPHTDDVRAEIIGTGN